MIKRNKENGITLIALVITIIVLLILAGVAISMLSGENGILKKAAEAKTKTEEESFMEQLKVATLGAMANSNGKINKDELKEELKKIGIDEANIVDDRNDGYIIKKGDYGANIKNNGNILDLSGISENDIELDKYFISKGSNFMCREGYITGVQVNKTTIENKIKTLEDALPEGYKVEYKYSGGADVAIEENEKENKTLATGMAVTKNGNIVARVVIFGDVDGDGQITAGDASEISGYIENNEIKKEFCILAMDINHDGYIGNIDSSIILHTMANIADVNIGEQQNSAIINIDKLSSRKAYEIKKEYISKLKPQGNTYVWKEGDRSIWLEGVTAETTGDELLNGLGLNGKANIVRNRGNFLKEKKITTEVVQNNDEIVLIEPYCAYGSKIEILESISID